MTADHPSRPLVDALLRSRHSIFRVPFRSRSPTCHAFDAARSARKTRMLNFHDWNRILHAFPGQARRDRPDHRRRRTRAEMTLDHTTVPGGAIMVPGIASATDVKSLLQSWRDPRDAVYAGGDGLAAIGDRQHRQRGADDEQEVRPRRVRCPASRDTFPKAERPGGGHPGRVVGGTWEAGNRLGVERFHAEGHVAWSLCSERVFPGDVVDCFNCFVAGNHWFRNQVRLFTHSTY